VPDASTAEFMQRFYRHLKSGASKDEALRQVQVEFLHLPKFARPFYWAAFLLVGDPL
jgi:CHAT domain-containing protein